MTKDNYRAEEVTPEILEEMKSEYRLKTAQAKYPKLIIPSKLERDSYNR